MPTTTAAADIVVATYGSHSEAEAAIKQLENFEFDDRKPPRATET